LIQRAKKHADKKVVQSLTRLFAKESNSNVGLVINERMLHFPPQIAGPALNALKFVQFFQ
jgi:hypothetical protein